MRASVSSRRLLRAAAILALAVPAFTGCKGRSEATATTSHVMPVVAKPDEAVHDPHSFSNPAEVVVRSISLDLTADFEKRTLSGSATLHVENLAHATRLVLDTRDLDIRSVTLGDASSPAKYTLGEEKVPLGRPLTVEILPDTKIVTVDYATSPRAEAVQWLEPSQTAGRKYPFFFTQSQAILARTWIPCQDSPSVRMTYDATIHVPKELLALMSAENPQAKNDTGVYHFSMPQPVPSYLFALAIGDLEFRPLSDRAGVYAEPGTIEKAAWELADTPKMIATAESLYGPYRWGRYDILVLPPSFPFGGMENPRLTFATPTILAGDRSLVSLVAHELAHSWSGNLVTNATWSDFWLNEGVTVYIEERIMEALYGRAYSEMLALLAMQDLKEDLASLKPDSPDTWLAPDLAGRDPDQVPWSIGYDKGYFFLRHCEETVGREKWDAFLRQYFDSHAFKSITSTQFVACLESDLIKGDSSLRQRIGADRWIYGPGLPADAPKITSERFDAVDRQLERFKTGTPARDLVTAGWSTHEWVHLLRNLPADLTLKQMSELDAVFGFTTSGNAEILLVWLQTSIHNGYKPAMPAVAHFLTSVGRTRLVQPLYAELVKTPDGRKFAERVFAEAKAGYHPVTSYVISKVLGQPTRQSAP